MNLFKDNRFLVPIVLVGVALILLSAIVETSVTNAAPELFAGLVVVAFATTLLNVTEPSERLSFTAAVALLFGGLLTTIGGLATLSLVPSHTALEPAKNAVLVVGFALYAFHLWGPR